MNIDIVQRPFQLQLANKKEAFAAIKELLKQGGYPEFDIKNPPWTKYPGILIVRSNKNLGWNGRQLHTEDYGPVIEYKNPAKKNASRMIRILTK